LKWRPFVKTNCYNGRDLNVIVIALNVVI